MIKDRERHRQIANNYRILHQRFEIIYKNYARHGYEVEAALYEKVADGFKEVYLKYEQALNA